MLIQCTRLFGTYLRVGIQAQLICVQGQKNPKAIMYDKRLKMKRDAQLKAEKDCFQLGISLNFQAFIVRYGFTPWRLMVSQRV